MELKMALYLLYWAVIYTLALGVTAVFYVGIAHLLIVWPVRAYRRWAARANHI